MNSEKKDLIKKLISIASELKDIADAKEDNQALFVAETIAIVLHAAASPCTADMLHKYMNKYIEEFGLLSNQITLKDYLFKQVNIVEN